MVLGDDPRWSQKVPVKNLLTIAEGLTYLLFTSLNVIHILAGCNEEFEDILQFLCPIEISNNYEFSLDGTALEEIEIDLTESFEKLPIDHLVEPVEGKTKDDSCFGQIRSGPKKRGRPKGVFPTGDLLRERRNAANARERKRMNQLTR